MEQHNNSRKLQQKTFEIENLTALACVHNFILTFTDEVLKETLKNVQKYIKLRLERYYITEYLIG